MSNVAKSVRDSRKRKRSGATNLTDSDVLTLSEAATFLRVTEDEVEALASTGVVPGRRIGREWRFLQSALEDWLRATSQANGRDALLALAGAFKDDPHLEQIVADAYRKRGRRAAEARQ